MNQELANLAHDIESAFELSDSLIERSGNALKENVQAPPSGSEFRLALAADVGREAAGRAAVERRDPYVGLGKGPTLPHALLASVIAALAQSQ